MQHRNAPLTPNGRRRRGLSCLKNRSSRPRTSPVMLSDRDHGRCCEVRKRTGWGPRLVASEVGIPHATVHRALRRRGCPGNILHIDTKRHASFLEPGHAVTGKRTHASRGSGWELVHTIVDDCSRLAYVEVHGDERARTVADVKRTRRCTGCWPTGRLSTGGTKSYSLQANGE